MTIEFLHHSSVVALLVLAALLLTSVASWALIVGKFRQFGRHRRSNTVFENQFWSGRTLDALYQEASAALPTAAPLARVFVAGMHEWAKLRELGVVQAGTWQEGLQRAIRAAMEREMNAAEAHMDLIASVGSTAPYVGLFGTVWGIMHAMTGLANQVGSISLANVAPGISEALTATAVGLLVAIPAVLAHNRLSRHIEDMASGLESFSDDFTNVLARQMVHRPPVAGR